MNIREQLTREIENIESYSFRQAPVIDLPMMTNLLRDAHKRIVALEEENSQMWHSLHPEEMGG